MKKDRSTFAGTALLVAAVVASLVSILPLLSGVWGVKCFAVAGFLERWRLVLLGLGWGLLALGFWSNHGWWREAHRQPNVDGQAPPRRGIHLLLRLAAALVVVGSTLPQLSGWSTLATTRARLPAPGISKTAASRVVLKIAGMDCPMCSGHLQSDLRKLAGVTRAEVSFQDKQATVEYDPGRVDPSRLAQVVEKAGFKVTELTPAAK